MTINDSMMANGILRFGLIASSPVAAKQSKPTKPKKHFAAPDTMPATPYGIKPPSPPLTLCGIFSFFIDQFAGLAEKNWSTN